ncbi:MAG TPA: glycosyltransferase family 1 protein [Chitinophagaceae bacterium]|nr:glycosyltransferase family 1 protein [Chitinophagaceae bacterium]
MRILYDHQCFTNDRIGGISKYFYKLMDQFSADQDLEIDVAGKFSNNLYALQLNGKMNFSKFFPDQDFRGQRRILKILNKRQAVNQLRKGQFDIFHPTYYNPYFLDHVGDKKMVLTVHDMIYEIFGMKERYSSYSMLEAKKELIRRSDKVIAISASTKRDILRFIQVPHEKIEVIYHGVERETKTYPEDFLKLPAARFFLFVGKREGYKNFSFMLDSIAPLLRECGAGLICAGGGVFSRDEVIQIERLRLKQQVHFFPSLSDDQLSFLYQKAIALIYPSLYEGFGMPLLEAARNKCPVISSNSSSLPEVGGDAVLYFNAGDADGLLKSAEDVFYEPALRDELIQKGLSRANEFGWDRTFEQTKSLYRSL